MKLVYKENTEEKLHKLVETALKAGRKIDYIELTEEEAKDISYKYPPYYYLTQIDGTVYKFTVKVVKRLK